MGSLIAGIITAVLGAVATIATGVATNEQNKKIQEQTNAQNLALTQEAWRRDDNAVQRRKEDLIAAGFNPVLATGSAASNTNPITSQSFRAENPVNFGMFDSLGSTLRNAKLDYLAKQSDLETAADNRALIQAQTKSIGFNNVMNMMRNLQNIRESNARIGDISFNQTYKNNRLQFEKEQARSARELGIANWMLQKSLHDQKLFDNQMSWRLGLPSGSHDVISKYGIDRILGLKDQAFLGVQQPNGFDYHFGNDYFKD